MNFWHKLEHVVGLCHFLLAKDSDCQWICLYGPRYCSVGYLGCSFIRLVGCSCGLKSCVFRVPSPIYLWLYTADCALGVLRIPLCVLVSCPGRQPAWQAVVALVGGVMYSGPSLPPSPTGILAHIGNPPSHETMTLCGKISEGVSRCPSSSAETG